MRLSNHDIERLTFIAQRKATLEKNGVTAYMLDFPETVYLANQKYALPNGALVIMTVGYPNTDDVEVITKEASPTRAVIDSSIKYSNPINSAKSKAKKVKESVDETAGYARAEKIAEGDTIKFRNAEFKVVEVTKRQIITNKFKFRRSDGRLWGRDQTEFITNHVKEG